jgi:hypothetical protein
VVVLIPIENQVEQWLGKETKREEALEPWTIGLIELARRRSD